MPNFASRNQSGVWYCKSDANVGWKSADDPARGTPSGIFGNQRPAAARALVWRNSRRVGGMSLVGAGLRIEREDAMDARMCLRDACFATPSARVHLPDHEFLHCEKFKPGYAPELSRVQRGELKSTRHGRGRDQHVMRSDH